MGEFFYSLPRNLISAFAGRKALWHVLAIALTYMLVVTGWDWKYFVAVRSVHGYFIPSLIVGGLLPILLPLGLLAYAKIRRREDLRVTAWMLAQAALLGSLISSTYKALTGRIQPDLTNYALDISNGFQFGFWEHGIFWGWPSSHTTIAFSMAVALYVRYPEKKALRVAALLYAAYIGTGVSMSIHWLSDAVAGLIIGTVIGLTVGSRFGKGRQV
jgi:membrane-associated phospholipid phosphatase